MWELAYYLDIHWEKFNGLTAHMTNPNKLKLWLDYILCENPIK